MKINSKQFFLISLSLLCFFAASFYLVHKFFLIEGDRIVTPAETGVGGKETVEAEIIDEIPDQITDEIQEEAEEMMLEEDAENLEVKEESEMFETEMDEDNDPPVKYPILPEPLAKKSDPDTLMIGFMTDLHVRSADDKGISLDGHYAEKINYFIERMNNAFIPNFIMMNGDVIDGTKTSAAIGSNELALVKRFADRTSIKKYWVAGNHDLRSVSKKQWMDTLGIDYMYKSFDVGNYKIITLDGNFTKEDKNVGPGIGYTRGKVSDKQLEWLKRELEKTEKKVIVFMHYPPLRDINTKNNLGLLYNAKELQSIFSQYGVLAVFSGHIEDLYYQEFEGVDYFVSPGMVKYPKYSGAFSEITIKGKKINITLNYLKEDGAYRKVEIEK